MNTQKPWLRMLAYPAVALALMAGTCDVTREESSTTTAFRPASTATTVAITPPPDGDRVEELTAIAAALNVNRLAAIYNLDIDAARAVDGTDELFSLDRGQINNGGWDFLEEPGLDNIPYAVTGVILDRPDCAVLATFIDLRAVLGFDETEEQIEVIFFDEAGIPSLANVFPTDASSAPWGSICDSAERTAVPIDGS